MLCYDINIEYVRKTFMYSRRIKKTENIYFFKLQRVFD